MSKVPPARGSVPVLRGRACVRVSDLLIRSLHEVRFRCCEGEGVGVAPDHERMHLPAELHRCLIQRDEERVRRPERCENFGRQISAINDMITGTRVLNAKTWRHTANPPLLP